MTALAALHARLFGLLETRVDPHLMPTLARLVFAGTLLIYFWNSGLTKLGEGIAGLVSPSFNAYVQILPRMSEAVGYDASRIPALWRLVVTLGTWAEFILPALLLIGFLTRLAALGMIGFILVQSYVDIVGHHADPSTIGAWFDTAPGSLILDQRAFWVFLLLTLVMRGAGPLSLDAILTRPRAQIRAA